MSSDRSNFAAGSTDALAERLLSLFITNTKDYAFALTDARGAIVGWKGAASDVLGFAEDEVKGKPIDLIFTEEDRQKGLPEFEREMASANGRAEDDRWHVRRDGARVWVSGALLALRERGVLIGFAKVMRDRTDIRAQIETLRNHNSYLEQSVAARDVTFAKITHEIRNSLMPLKSAAKLLNASIEATQTKTAHAILERQLALIESMAHDLSEASRVSVGKFRLNKEPLDIAAELPEIVNVAKARAVEKRQEVLVFVPDTPVVVSADRQRLQQIVFNLLDNAIKYTGESGHIWVKCIVEVDDVLIKIEDDGIGISAFMLPRIFDLFTREAGNDETNDQPDGFGIGLALVKTLVEEHNGKMEVRSEGKGKGSEFAVRLPLLKNSN